MSNWTQLRLIAPPENADVCAQMLLDAGCDGVQVDDSTVLFDESEDATLVTKTEAVVTGYLTSQVQVEPATGLLQDALQRSQIPARLETELLAEQDWATAWREHFPPLHIGPFLIVPSWEDKAADEVHQDDTIVIRLDPGLAFGTGQHPTTHMCLELLAEHLRREKSIEGEPATMPVNMLDVGCGSGILSIAATKLGAQVTASDLDPFCVRATGENAAVNNVSINVVQAAGLEWAATQFDLVVANLMSALLVSLAVPLAGVIRAGGTLIVSGISAPRATDVEAELNAAGFTTMHRRDQDGEQRGDFIERWTAFVMKK